MKDDYWIFKKGRVKISKSPKKRKELKCDTFKEYIRHKFKVDLLNSSGHFIKDNNILSKNLGRMIQNCKRSIREHDRQRKILKKTRIRQTKVTKIKDFDKTVLFYQELKILQ